MADKIIYDYDLFTASSQKDSTKRSLSVLQLNQQQFLSVLQQNINLKSTLFLLVLSGTAEVEINFRKHQVQTQDMLLLSFGHLFKIQQVSSDFVCLSLYIEKDYVAEMFSIDMLYKRVKYNVKMYKNPILHLNDSDFNLLTARVRFINDISLQTQHNYYREMLLNALRIYFLDLSHCIETNYLQEIDDNPSREDVYFQQFLTLILKHYKTEHLVQFYADHIHITSHYLTQIVKKLTGQTVSDFIFDLLYSEARQLLKQPDLTVQEIADILNFSDQSAFGKFFKRKSGMSPLSFRKL